MVKITLIRSLIAAKPGQKATAAAFGLRKIGDSNTVADDAAAAGIIKVLSHLVKVEKA